MRRRKLLERVGAASVAATGAAGVVSADTTRGYTHVVWELDGEMQQFELQEFHAHPATPSLQEVDGGVTDEGCPDGARCCDCLQCIGCGGFCGSCSDCGAVDPCDCCDQCDVC